MSRGDAEAGDRAQRVKSGLRGDRTDRTDRADRAPAMTDVARLAGVSHQTVSRVINAHPMVSDKTRSRVQAAMTQLGYRPNVAARVLATGSSRTIGVVAQNTTLFGPASILAALGQAAAQAELAVTVSSVAQLNDQAIRAAVEAQLAQGVAGIVVIAPVESANDALDAVAASVPVVAIDGDPRRPNGLVTVDQYRGAELATCHLLDAGHSTVWHVSGPDGWFDAAGRIAGWQSTLESAGAEIPPVLQADWSPASGYHAGQTLARIPEVAAVFAANDHIALGLLKAFREAGRAVPDEISIVGFDDIAEAAYFAPPLTTVRPDFQALGREALELLVGQIEAGHSLPARPAIVPKLVCRSSVATR